MIDFLRSTVEWKNWGMNVLTISALGTLVLTVVQARSFAKQAKAIWNSGKGDSVSVTMFGYLQFYLVAFASFRSCSDCANIKNSLRWSGVLWRRLACCQWLWP